MSTPTWAPAPSRLADWFDRSEAAHWGLSVDDFRRAVLASAAHAFAGRAANDNDLERYAAALHHRDVALACACAAGHEQAWETFVAEYRPLLYRAADAIDPSGRARDLADSLYADLYGVREKGGVRQSLFRYFHGRSSLATWLRAVLAQRLVDRVREDRKTTPLPEDDHQTMVETRPASPDPARTPCVDAVTAAISAAIGALDPRDRLRLGAYYVQHLTLAEIGRLLKEHEASASRHLSRARASIRDAMRAHLQREGRMTPEAMADCLASMLDDAGPLDLARVLSPHTAGKIPAPRRSKD